MPSKAPAEAGRRSISRVKPPNSAAVTNAFWPTPSVQNTAGNASSAGTNRQSGARSTLRITRTNGTSVATWNSA